MSFTIEYGDLFQHKAQALAHGVNCMGIAGAGVAALMRKHYPQAIEAYEGACDTGKLLAGGAYVSLPKRIVAHCASQHRPGPDARAEWLLSSLASALVQLEHFGVETVALPLIGAGIGGIPVARSMEIIREVSEASPLSVTLVLREQ